MAGKSEVSEITQEMLDSWVSDRRERLEDKVDLALAKISDLQVSVARLETQTRLLVRMAGAVGVALLGAMAALVLG